MSARARMQRSLSVGSACPRWLYSTLRLILLLPGFVIAQSPSASRLEQLEATYLTNLRPLHAPVLQDYLRQLELLKNQFTARNRADDARQVDAEIQRVKSIISTTGVLPYPAVHPPPTGASPASAKST